MNRVGWRTGEILFLLFLTLLLPATVRAENRIAEVRAEVLAEGQFPSPVKARMESSVAAIAEQLLAGQLFPLPDTERKKKEQVIREVFDKVLVGYSVYRVRIVPEETALVQVFLFPWDARIRDVGLSVSVDGMGPETEQIVRRDLTGVEQVFSECLIGLPIAAADWSNGLIKKQLRSFMEEHLPEFWADFDVAPQEHAQIRLTVYPRLPVVRTVDISMRSDTILNLALVNHRTLMQEKANLLVGVPVTFAERHVREYSKLLENVLDSRKDFRAMGMQTRVTMKIGEHTSVMSRSDSGKYRLRLTGWADIGRDRNASNDILLRLHAGRRLSARDELFLLMDVTPQDMTWQWALGYERDVLPGTTLSLRYEMRDSGFVASAEQAIGKNWGLRYEYRFDRKQGEGALRYRIHDFLSVEYVVDPEDNWLRLIGNF